MATKNTQVSPTMNIFDLLADDQTNQPQEKKKDSDSGLAQTPKQRAEAKAVENAERQAKREADRKKKAEDELRRKAFTEMEEGFSQQRNQRVKAMKSLRNQPKDEDKKFKGKGKGNYNNNNNRNNNNRNNNNRNNNNNNNNNQGGGRGPRREFDKKSQNGPRQFNAKKGGHGKGNWDNATENVPTDGFNSEGFDGFSNVADNVPSTQASANVTSDDTWGDAPAEGTAAEGTDEWGGDDNATSLPTEGNEWGGDDNASAAFGDEEEEEEEEVKTFEEYEQEKAAQEEELARLVGGTRSARQLTEDEKKGLGQFTLVENTKNVTAQVAEKTDSESDKPQQTARKGEKAVEFTSYFKVQEQSRGGRGGRGGRGRGGRGRGGRGRGGRDNNNHNNHNNNNSNNHRQKIESKAFPALA